MQEKDPSNVTHAKRYPQITYWLIPSEPYLSKYQNIIKQLAQDFDGPSFIPHVTLYCGPSGTNDSTEEVVELVHASLPISLRVEDIRFTDAYTKCYFVQYEKSQLLTRLCDRIKATVSSPSDYQIDPHLSLFYGTLSDESREAISKIGFEVHDLTFNRVVAVGLSDKIDCKGDVEAWKIIASS